MGSQWKLLYYVRKYRGFAGAIEVSYRHNGKENGNYYTIQGQRTEPLSSISPILASSSKKMRGRRPEANLPGLQQVNTSYVRTDEATHHNRVSLRS